MNENGLNWHVRKLNDLLAHLSWRFIWWAYRIRRPPSSSIVHTLNLNISSETTGPIKSQISYEASVGERDGHIWSLSQSLNLRGRRGTTDDIATIPSTFPVFRCPQGISKPHSHPFLDVTSVFPSLRLSSSPSCSYHCPLQNCLWRARGSWDVAIPSEFPFLYHG